MNCALHRIAITQIRLDSPGRRYYRKRLMSGDSPTEALRCLIGEVSRVRLGRMPGRGFSVVLGDGLVAEPL